MRKKRDEENEYPELFSNFFKGAIYLVVFDLSSQSSQNRIEFWVHSLMVRSGKQRKKEKKGKLKELTKRFSKKTKNQKKERERKRGRGKKP